MCITFFYINENVNCKIKFLVAFNREENVNRATDKLNYFKEDDNILGGRDIKESGTWLAYNKKNKNIAFLTNFKHPSINPQKGKISRGFLIYNFLKSTFYKNNEIKKQEIIDYLREIKENKNNYSPFNLVIGNLELMKFYYYGNYNIVQDNIILEGGIHTMCNSEMFMETINERQKRGRLILQKIISLSNNISLNEIKNEINQNIMSDYNTGAFKNIPFLTTLSSSVLIIDENYNFIFSEITYQYRFPKLARYLALLPFKQDEKIEKNQI